MLERGHYSLFYLRREREERAAGAGPQAALQPAAATSGRAILTSGLTVMVAMAGMFFAGSRTFSSFAVGTILVVAVAVLGSLTVLLAMMSALGPRVEKGRVPLLHRFRRDSGADSRIWGWLLERVMRRPGLAACVGAAALAALALPVLGMHTALPGAASLPREIPIMRTYDRIQAAFPGGSSPAVVGVQAPDVRAARIQAGIARLIRRAGTTPGLLAPVTTLQSHDHRSVPKIPNTATITSAALVTTPAVLRTPWAAASQAPSPRSNASRARGRDPDRRHGDSRHPLAGDPGAARRSRLVPAALVALVARWSG